MTLGEAKFAIDEWAGRTGIEAHRYTDDGDLEIRTYRPREDRLVWVNYGSAIEFAGRRAAERDGKNE